MGALPRRYRSAVRAAQADATRARIVEVAYGLLRTTRPVDLSYADVAAEARVSVRTVYRYFPSPDDLFLAVSQWMFGSQLDRTLQAESAADLLQDLEGWFGRLEEDPAIFRVLFAVPSRSPIDLPGTLARAFRSELAHLSDEDRRSALALIELLGCPYAWDVMHHNYALPLERSVRAVQVGVQAVIDYLAREPRALSPDAPPPTLTRRGDPDEHSE
jgi:AcrR family transcriptional regulator